MPTSTRTAEKPGRTLSSNPRKRRMSRSPSTVTVSLSNATPRCSAQNRYVIAWHDPSEASANSTGFGAVPPPPSAGGSSAVNEQKARLADVPADVHRNVRVEEELTLDALLRDLVP